MSDFGDALALQIPRLRRYARALTHDRGWADDLVQDTLERALQRRWLFHFNSNLTAWLFTILYRLYLNDISYRKTSLLDTLEDIPEPEMPGDIGWQMDMRRALARLSEEHRAVIVLVGLEQLSYREAAEVLNVPLGTVMSRLTRARRQLRALLDGTTTSQVGTTTANHLTRVK
jgi:RNA polymerase sigma-70 factor (ECF subfamily)